MAQIHERKSPRGKSSWRVRVRLKGQPDQTATFASKTKATWSSATRISRSSTPRGSSLEWCRASLGRGIIPRIKVLGVRVTAGEFLRIVAAAEDVGMLPVAWVRHLVLCALGRQDRDPGEVLRAASRDSAGEAHPQRRHPLLR